MDKTYEIINRLDKEFNSPYIKITNAESTQNTIAWSPSLYLEYSFDLENWTRSNGNEEINFNTVIYLRAYALKIQSPSYGWSREDGMYCNKQFDISGDISYLIGPDNPDIRAREFYRFFYRGKVRDAYNLNLHYISLPSYTGEGLDYGCFDSMFEECSNLIRAPKILPALNLGKSCYMSMFYKCINLEKAPALPAMNLAEECYRDMFMNCSKLATPPKLPATTLYKYSYSSMFQGCSSLYILPKIHATILPQGSCEEMFLECTKIKASETLDGQYIHEYRIPIIGTGQSDAHALDNMFALTGGIFKGTPLLNTTYYTSNRSI